MAFTDTSTGDVATWTWDFGDGSGPGAPDTRLPNPVHAFPHGGPFDVTLTVTNTAGDLSGHLTKTVAVDGPAAATFTVNQQPGTLDLRFTDTTPGSSGSSWAFDDGTNLTGQTVEHLYLTPGPYQLTLTSTTPAGPVTTTTAITVDPATSTPSPTPTASPTPSPSPTPTASPTPSPSPTGVPTPTPPTSGGGPSGRGILVSASDIARLPTSGPAWDAMHAAADASPVAKISDQDSTHDTDTLAAALVYARTGDVAYQAKALANIKAAVGTEAGGRTLAEARNLPGYVIAADVIDLPDLDPTFDAGTFRPWLRSVLTEPMTEGVNLVWTQENRPNNWGTHAGAARAAIAAYLGDGAEMARTAMVFQGWLGDRSVYAGFTYGDLSWQCDPTHPVGVNPAGCMNGAVSIDGVLPDDMRRGGKFQWPPIPTGYEWEALQGATLEAELLTRAGYPAWQWSDQALRRAVDFLLTQAAWPAVGDDTWQPWLVNHAYGTSYLTVTPTIAGKNFGFTDWLYGS